MRRPDPLRWLSASLLGALLWLPGLSVAHADDPEGSIAQLERRLELARHSRLLGVQTAPGAALTPFTTDGCSGGLSAGWDLLAERFPKLAEVHGDEPPWEGCCVTHDRAYHAGAPRDATPAASYAARLMADQALQACVVEVAAARAETLASSYGVSAAQVKAAYDWIALLMLRAVRLGGGPCSGLPWRWGYGWPDCR
jgi:hypothetical protein